MAAPDQPSLLRLLHGLTALLIGLYWFTGLAVVSEFDGRWGRLPLRLPEAIDLHGSLAVLLILVSALFVPYAFTLGRARLRRPANAVAPLARGGPALPLSMLQWRIRTGDGPGHWPAQLRRFFGFPPSPPPNGPPD